MVVKSAAQINIRVPSELAEDLDLLADHEHLGRTDVARQILHEGVLRRKRDLALDLYRQGKVTRSRAAEMAGISLWEVMDLLDRTPVATAYTLEDALDEVRHLVHEAAQMTNST